jgi:hypothetical protein
MSFAFYLILASLLLAELGVRLSGYSERHIYDPIYTPFHETTDIPYIHKPNLVNARARGLAIMNTDCLGLRTLAAGRCYGPKQKNEYRIAVVGDSVTFGEGVSRTNDTFPQILEDTLSRKRPNFQTRVFNYGVSAYSVKEMAATMQYRMLSIEPDLVIMAIIIYDFFLHRTPTVDGTGHLVNRSAPAILANPMVAGAIRQLHLAYWVRDITASWLNTNRGNVQGLRHGELPESYSYLLKFRAIAENNKRRYLFVLLPAGSPRLFDGMRQELRRERLPFVDFSSLIEEFSTSEYRASRFDGHPSARVHKTIGEALADYILETDDVAISRPAT